MFPNSSARRTIFKIIRINIPSRTFEDRRIFSIPNGSTNNSLNFSPTISQPIFLQLGYDSFSSQLYRTRQKILRFFEKKFRIINKGREKAHGRFWKEISSKKEERKKGRGTLRQIQRGWRVTMLAKDVYIYGGTRREHGCNDALSVTMHRCATLLLERGVSRVVTMLLRAATTG